MKNFLILIAITVVGVFLFRYLNTSPIETTTPQDSEETIGRKEDRDADTTYEQKEYRIAMVSASVPQNYRSVLNQKEASGPVLNIYSPEFEEDVKPPLNPHSDERVSQVSIFPEGFASELPSGETKIWSEYTGDLPQFNFDIDTEKSEVFVLENGEPWAFFVVPNTDEVPRSWNQYGFVWATISTDNMLLTCYDKEINHEKSITECDPLEGDRVVRKGSVDHRDKKIVLHILESMSLLSQDEIETPIGDLIQVKEPLPNNDISSPLVVKGEVVGNWFFEGTFLVELLDAHGAVIAEANAHSKENWMTEDVIPFSAELTFTNAPRDERGELVFHKANPSGLPEHDQSYHLPVIFPPQP